MDLLRLVNINTLVLWLYLLKCSEACQIRSHTLWYNSVLTRRDSIHYSIHIPNRATTCVWQLVLACSLYLLTIIYNLQHAFMLCDLHL